jgi:hypothetical protein
MKVAAGLALLVVAFAEKLGAADMAVFSLLPKELPWMSSSRAAASPA